MKKTKRVVGRGRMTPAAIAAVVAEIEAHKQGQRDMPLSWGVLETFSGFSRVSLSAKPTIKAAFQATQQSRRSDATPNIKAPRTTDERVVAMHPVSKADGSHKWVMQTVRLDDFDQPRALIRVKADSFWATVRRPSLKLSGLPSNEVASFTNCGQAGVPDVESV